MRGAAAFWPRTARTTKEIDVTDVSPLFKPFRIRGLELEESHRDGADDALAFAGRDAYRTTTWITIVGVPRLAWG